MKSGFILLLVLLLLSIYAVGDDGDQSDDQEKAKPGRKVPADPLTVTNSDELLEELQGGKKDVFVIVFYTDKSKGDQVVNDINDQLVKGDDATHPWIRVTSVPLTDYENYGKLFRVLNMEGEPKKGHTTTQVLIMSDGEGYVLQGPKLIEGIKKRIDKVEREQVYSSGSSSSRGYSIGG